MKKKIGKIVFAIVILAFLLIQVCRNIFLTFPILQAFQPIHE